jgi:CubicO group peptidase (beta-lactamase class C family)
MVERITEKSFEDYVQLNFYQSIGAYSMGYHPLKKFSTYQIAPTENDLVFRRQVVHGFVHDPGAAMLGGVSGHAGLFSNANDVAKMMQMMLSGGTYGGQRFLNEKLIEEYTACVDCKNGNRRGLGFDKPETDSTKSGPTFSGIPAASFGHTGFTGTMVWADPVTGIVFVFLSNRVYPNVLNHKLVQLNVRTNVQQAVYDALIDDSWKTSAREEGRRKKDGR